MTRALLGRIVTSHEFPPIPVRQFDWLATRESYEPGEPIGYGATEEAAIRSLRDAEDEAIELGAGSVR